MKVWIIYPKIHTDTKLCSFVGLVDFLKSILRPRVLFKMTLPGVRGMPLRTFKNHPLLLSRGKD